MESCPVENRTFTKNNNDQWNRAGGFETAISTSFWLKLNSPPTNMIDGIMPRWKSHFHQKQQWSMESCWWFRNSHFHKFLVEIKFTTNKQTNHLAGIETEYCTRNSVNTNICTVENALVQNTNHLASHGYEILLPKQCLTHDTALFMMQSFEKQTNLLACMDMLYCFQNNVNTHENLHHSRCNRSTTNHLARHRTWKLLRKYRQQITCMASQLKIASKTVSTHMNLRCSWCNRSKNKQITWRVMEMLNCFENKVNTHDTALFMMQSFEKQTKHLAWHGYVILLPKQCQHTWESAPFKMQSFKTQITLRGIALENGFENIANKSPAWHRTWKLLHKQCQHTWACTVMQWFEKQTNHLAWHGYVELLRKQCQRMRICTIQGAIVQNKQIALYGIAIENCFENTVKTTPAWHRTWKLLRKQCQHTWACTVMQSFEKQTNHLARHGYVELLRKQCQRMRICTHEKMQQMPALCLESAAHPWADLELLFCMAPGPNESTCQICNKLSQHSTCGMCHVQHQLGYLDPNLHSWILANKSPVLSAWVLLAKTHHKQSTWPCVGSLFLSRVTHSDEVSNAL